MLVKLKEDSVEVTNSFCTFCSMPDVRKIQEEWRTKYVNRTGRHYILGFYGSEEDSECSKLLDKYRKPCIQSDNFYMCVDCMLESINQIQLSTFKKSKK